jgi:ribonuclease-3
MVVLAKRLGWEVSNPALLAQSVAHRSWCAEHPGVASNERLEFLGDAVLGWVVTDHLYCTYPDLPEGELAKVRSSLVNSVALADVAAGLSLGDAMLLGKGEDLSGGREKPSILADATEAVIGAVYLDRGPAAARDLVMALLGQRIAGAAAGPGGEDYKTRLQERCARDFEGLPAYVITEDGPDHAKHFDAVVVVNGEALGSGAGRSKKQAEQAAARAAWDRLDEAAGAGRPGAGKAGPTAGLDAAPGAPRPATPA